MTKVGVIIGIAAAGVIIACVIGISSIRLILRMKHKRRMTKIATEIEDALSRVPSSHMHISDEDVARMPGTKITVRSSFQSQSPYTPMSSREPLESRPALKTIERAKSSNEVGHEAATPLQSWPLPRRLTRSDGTPLANPPKSSTSPKNRREDRRRCSLRSMEKEPQRFLKHYARPTSLDIIQNKLEPYILPNAELRPRPLFHGQQRSVSHKDISQLAQSRNATGPQSIYARAGFLPHFRHPRAMSVYSQEPGAPPTHVLPPLPFETTHKETKNAENSADPRIYESLCSNNTEILNDEESKVLSQADHDLTSVGLASPHALAPALEPKRTRPGLWDTAEMQEKASPISAQNALKLRPQLNTLKSSRGSNLSNISKSRNSDLSMSLLNHVPQDALTATSRKDQSQQVLESKISSPSRPTKKENDQSRLQSSPRKYEIRSKRGRNSESRRASISELKSVSGDEDAPTLNPADDYLSIPAIDDPFQATSYVSIPPEKLEDEVIGDGPLSVDGIPNNMLANVASRKSACIDARDEHFSLEQYLDTIVRRPKYRQSPTQLPSNPVSKPHATPNRGQISTAAQTPPFSPTLAMFDFYEGASSSPESAISTPTRKPSHRASPGSRLSSVFDNPFSTSWHFSTKNNSISSGRSHHHPSQDLNAWVADSRPPSFLFDFPIPPKPTFSSWRRIKAPIHGPRSPPHDSRASPIRCRLSRSRSKSSAKLSSTRVSKNYSDNSPSFDLRRSIMTLRRQNSEINNHQNGGSREHKRYLSIGAGYDGGSAMNLGNE